MRTYVDADPNEDDYESDCACGMEKEWLRFAGSPRNNPTPALNA